MLGKVRKLLAVMVSEGLGGIAQRVEWRLRRFLSLHQEFLCLELDLTKVEPRYTPRSRFLIRRLTDADYPLLSSRLNYMEKVYYFLFRTADEIPYGAFDDGRLIAHLGMGIRRYRVREIGYDLDLGPLTIYGNGLAVDKAYRKTLVTGALLEHAFLDFKAQGYLKCVTITQTTNSSSLNMSAHFGFCEIHRITSKRIWMIRRRPRIVYTDPEPSFEGRKRPKRGAGDKAAGVAESE